MTPIEYAIKLKKDKQVILYRKYLKEIENAFNTGRWNEIFEFEETTKELVRDIYRKKSFVDSVTINLWALPSINVSIGNMHKKKIHLSFLRKLERFSYLKRKK